MKHKEIEAPQCELGYTDIQLKRILGDRYREFMIWMRGQTAGICDGRRFNNEKKEYEPTDCGPHGFVIYSWDLNRFLKGLPIVD